MKQETTNFSSDNLDLVCVFIVKTLVFFVIAMKYLATHRYFMKRSNNYLHITFKISAILFARTSFLFSAFLVISVSKYRYVCM